MTINYRTLPSDFAYFTGSFSLSEIGGVVHMLQEVEKKLDLPPIPDEAGEPWTISTDQDGLATVSRFGVKYVFAAGSPEAAARKVNKWAQDAASSGTSVRSGGKNPR